jgi:polyisoprenoid-binding protein YceI
MSANRRNFLPLLTLTLLVALLVAGSAAGERYEVESGDSHVLAITGKAGLLGGLGHRHAVLGTELRGEFCFDPEAPGETKARVAVPTASLEIDGERGRELADIGKGPGADDVKQIQADMLSAEYLAADKHPEIVFALTGAKRTGEGKYTAQGEFELRGKAQEIELPVRVERGEEGLVVSGSFTVKQTDYGIEPASAAGGTVNVADEVEVRVRLVGAAAEGGCDG